MSNEFFINIGRFVFLILLQVMVLNQINFLGYVNPSLYILFILILPINYPNWQVILLGFLLGITVDIFEDTGGIHAAACLVISYLRPGLLRASYGLSYDYQTMKFHDTSIKERLTFVTTMVFIHELILSILVFFNFSHIILILKNTLFSGIFTILLILVVTSLSRKAKR